MTPEQMMSFYNVGKDMLVNSSGNSLSIKKTYLSYYSLPVWQPRAERYTSALGYYPESLEAIKKLMKVNLELETEKPIKTFNISYNEDYTTPLVGKGLTGGTKLERVKSFIGATETEALNWCQLNQLSCTFEVTTDYQTAGLIVTQSAHEGELVKSISKITFYISNGLGTPPTEETPNEEPNNNENTGDKPNEETNTENKNPEKEEDKEETPSTPENTTPENSTNNEEDKSEDKEDTSSNENTTPPESTTPEEQEPVVEKPSEETT